MKHLTKTILNRTTWLGRGTAMVMGLAMLLAAVPGDPFKLGQVNAVNTLTRLAGNTDNAMLRINNASSGANATALDLQVAPGKPPMKVNSTVKVASLNSDRLDGKDSTALFSSGRTYLGASDAKTGNGGGTELATVGFPCDPEDSLLSAGGVASFEDDMIEDRPTGTNSWLVRVRDNGQPTITRVIAICADFPPLGQQENTATTDH